MSDRNRIQRLAASGESHYLEFKRKVDNPEKIVKELIAFSNADGGKLLIGITDEGRLAGLDHPEGDWFLLEKAIKAYCRSGLKYSYHIIPISSKRSVIEVDVPISRRKPNYFQLARNYPREVYIRVKDECIRASREWASILSFERRQVFIEYGDQEKWLLDYLGENPQITLDEFSQGCGIPRKKASRVLVLLTAAGVLKHVPGLGAEDQFQLA